jgi:hypothetical protein
MRGFVLLRFRCCTSYRNVYRHHKGSFWTRILNSAIGTLCNYFFCLFLLYDIHVTLRNLVYVCLTFLLDLSRKNLKLKLHIVNRCVCKTAGHISKEFIFGFCTQKFWSNFISLVSIWINVTPVLYDTGRTHTFCRHCNVSRSQWKFILYIIHTDNVYCCTVHFDNTKVLITNKCTLYYTYKMLKYTVNIHCWTFNDVNVTVSPCILIH